MSVKFETEEGSYGRANEFFVDEEFEEALDEYTNAIELAKTENPLYYEKRAACYIKLNKFEEAVKDCEKAASLKPKKYSIYLKLGQALFELEKYEDAKTAFQKALENIGTKPTKLVRNWIRKCDAELSSRPIETIKSKAQDEKPKEQKVEEKKEEMKEEKKEEKKEEEKKYGRETIESTPDWIEKPPAPIPIKKKTLKELIRHQFFQMGSVVSLNILKLQNVPKENRHVTCDLEKVHVKLQLPDGDVWEKTFNLAKKVKSFKVKHMKSKTEITLEKLFGGSWSEFLKGEKEEKVDPKSYPTNRGVSWSSLESELSKEKDEDEDGPNSFFQKLFKDATPDQQKAMMKSYRESGGTVLSTNWDDVKKKKINVSPPEGMEQRRWDGYHEHIDKSLEEEDSFK